MAAAKITLDASSGMPFSFASITRRALPSSTPPLIERFLSSACVTPSAPRAAFAANAREIESALKKFRWKGCINRSTARERPGLANHPFEFLRARIGAVNFGHAREDGEQAICFD